MLQRIALAVERLHDDFARRTGFEMSAPAIADVFDRTVAEALGDLLIRTETEMDSVSRRALG